MSKKTDGLSSEEGLNVVGSAGFKKHKRKQLDEVSENASAGLHDKNGGDEVAKVKRKRPLSLKRKRRMMKAVVALSAVFIAALSLFGYGFFFSKPDIGEAEGEYYTEYLEVPTDGTTPADHNNGVENIGYMNYVLQSQPWWYSSMTSDIRINAVGLNIVQQVETFKQYYNDVLISADITKSSMVNSARQFCVINDPAVVLWRESAGGPSTYNGADTEWSTGEPSGLTHKEYRKTRGCLHSEFSVYIINEDTVLDYSEVTDNGDGTFSQTFNLNPASEPGENSAVYYYRYQMQSTGGLSKLPTFNYVTVTYTFDSSWRVLRSEIEESYKANMGPITANGVATSVTEYSYEEADAQNTYYRDYFKQYEDDFATPEEEGLTAASCLSAAFGGVLTGEAKLSVALDIGGTHLSGLVQLNINENDVRVDFGNIKAYMRPDEADSLYIAYGDNVKIKLPLSSISGAISGGDGEGGLDTDELMSQLANGEFTVNGDNTAATLVSELELLGLKVPLTFNFIVTDGEVSLGGVTANIAVLGTDIGAKLNFTQEGISSLTDTEAAKYSYLDTDGITPLFSAEALNVKLAYSTDNISVSGNVLVNIAELAVKADLRLVLGGDEAAAKTVSIIYVDGAAYLALASEGEDPFMVKASVSEISALIKELFPADEWTDETVDILDTVLDLVQNIGLDNILNTVLADRDFANIFATSGDGFTLTADGTELLKVLGADFDLGEVTATVSDGKIAFSALGIDGELEAAEPFTFDKGEYATDIIPLIKKVIEIVEHKGVTVSGALTLSTDPVTVTLNIYGLSVSWENGILFQLDARLSVNGRMHDIYAEYSEVSGALNIVYGAFENQTGVSLSLKENENGIVEDVATLSDALVALYNRIAGVVNTMAEGGDVLAPATDLNDLLELIDLGNSSTLGAADIIGALDRLESDDIFGIINSIEIGGIADGNGTKGIAQIKLDAITLSLYESTADGSVNIILQTRGLGVELENVKIVATEATDFGVNVPELLTADDLCELLDYVAAAVEMLAKDTFKIELTGTVISNADEYLVTDDEGNAQVGVKYDLTAGFEYSQGAEFPVHIDLGGEDREPNFWISPDIYAHVYVNLISTIDEVDSVLFDIYIFDGTPTIDKNGKTTGTLTEDGELDVFMSISRIPTEGTELIHEPVMIYAPMSEIMTVLAAGVALVDVGSITIDAIPELNGIIAQIGGVLDTLLVDRYFGDTKDQFTSLGSSLLETVLGGSLSDMLNDLLGGLLGGAEAQTYADALQAYDGFDRTRYGSFKMGVTANGKDTELTIEANGATATVKKQNTEAGSRLTNLYIENVSLNEADTLTELNFNIWYDGVGEGETQFTKPTALDGYTSIVGVDNLVMALINSATHEEAAEDGVSTYALNNSFFIDGTLSISIGQLVGHKVIVDGLSVNINSDGDVEVNARFHYDGMSVVILGDAVQGASTVDLTIKNGMVYMKRVQTTSFQGVFGVGSFKSITPITIYRAMPVEVFTGDILNQIAFLLNFNSSVMSLFNLGGDDEPTVEPKKDYGTQFAEYFNYITFSQNDGSAEWNVQINGTGLSNLAGITLSDIDVKINATGDRDGGYTVTGLGVSGTMYSIMTLGADLNWQNPQEQWLSDSAMDIADELAADNPGLTMSRWLGGTTFEEICKVIDWDSLPTTTEAGNYLELTFTGDAELPSGAVKFGTVEYYLRDLNGAETLLLSVDTILYYNTTLLSIVNVPDLTEYAINHYNLEWQLTSSANGVLKYVAVYMPEVYEVIFISEYEIEGYDHIYGNQLTFDFSYETDGHRIDYIEYKGVQYNAENYTEIVIDGDAEIYVHWVEVPAITVIYYSAVQYDGSTEVIGVEGYETAYSSTVKMSNDFATVTLSADGYMFLGWYYLDGDTWVAVSNVVEDIGAEIYNTYELHALWAVVTIEGSGTYTAQKSLFWTNYTYTMEGSISIEVFGNSDLASKVSLSSASFAFSVAGQSPNASSSELDENGAISVEGATTGKTTTTSASTATVNVTFEIAIDGNVVDNSWTATKSGLSVTAA